ncbi:carbohydrate ABC transporter permease [Candidatus Leptofilum sp.]|uniref:carbohydrate ABC transporter permease n=1 Tax=Candidatus Leptofilum sp. TaxID=3241576 RepID=UPI003B5A728B
MTIPVSSSNSKPKVITTDLMMQVFLLVVGLIVAMPIIIAIFTSFKSLQDISANPNTLLPREWTFDNYVSAWNATPFGRYLLNSFIQSAIIVVCQVLFSVLAAFAFTFLHFRGRDLMFYLILGSLMVPFQLTFIPNFILVSELPKSCIGLLGESAAVCDQVGANTYFGLTVPFLASAFGVFLLRQFFMSLPKELHDSARIDGASNFRFLWQIVVPLSKGSISAFSIFAFLSAWSQYLWPLIITNETNMRTVQIGIRFFLANQERGTNWGPLMAGAVIVMLPTLLLFLIANRQLVKGIAMTGLKG